MSDRALVLVILVTIALSAWIKGWIDDDFIARGCVWEITDLTTQKKVYVARPMLFHDIDGSMSFSYEGVDYRMNNASRRKVCRVVK